MNPNRCQSSTEYPLLCSLRIDPGSPLPRSFKLPDYEIRPSEALYSSLIAYPPLTSPLQRKPRYGLLRAFYESVCIFYRIFRACPVFEAKPLRLNQRQPEADQGRSAAGRQLVRTSILAPLAKRQDGASSGATSVGFMHKAGGDLLMGMCVAPGCSCRRNFYSSSSGMGKTAHFGSLIPCLII